MPLSTSDRNSLLRTAGYQAPGDQTKANLVTAAGAAGGTALGLPLGNKLEQFLKQVPQYDPRMKRLEGILQRGMERGTRLDTKGLTSIADKQAGKLQVLFNRTGKLTKGYGRAGKVGAILLPLLAATGGAFGGQAMGRKWYPNKPLPTDTPPGFPKVREGMMLGYGMGKSASVGNHAMAGLMSLLGVSLGVGTANTLYAHGAMAGADDLTDPHKGSVRGKLLDLAKEKDVFVGYPEELAKERFGGNPNVERQLNRMGPFYAKDLPPGSGPAIMKSKLFDRNGILAHELGHATDSEFVHDMQIKGQQVSPLLTLGILLGKGKSMGLSKMFAGAATGAQLPILYGEGSASVRGAKHMADAGAKGVKELAEPFMGLPTYLSAATIPTLAYLLKKRMLR